MKKPTLVEIDRLIEFYGDQEGVGKFSVLDALYEQRYQLAHTTRLQRARAALRIMWRGGVWTGTEFRLSTWRPWTKVCIDIELGLL